MGKHSAKVVDGVVAPTLGNRISHYAKAVAAGITATVILVTSILSTVPEGVLSPTVGVWISTGVAVAGTVAVWLVTNGPKIGEAVDRFITDTSETS